MRRRLSQFRYIQYTPYLRQPIHMHRLDPDLLELADELSSWCGACNNRRYSARETASGRVVHDTDLSTHQRNSCHCVTRKPEQLVHHSSELRRKSGSASR